MPRAKKAPPEKALTKTDEVSELVDAPKDLRQQATERAHKCAIELQEVLERHNCRIMPRIDIADIEPVGLAGNKVQIESTYWVAPLS